MIPENNTYFSDRNVCDLVKIIILNCTKWDKMVQCDVMNSAEAGVASAVKPISVKYVKFEFGHLIGSRNSISILRPWFFWQIGVFSARIRDARSIMVGAVIYKIWSYELGKCCCTLCTSKVFLGDFYCDRQRFLMFRQASETTTGVSHLSTDPRRPPYYPLPVLGSADCAALECTTTTLWLSSLRIQSESRIINNLNYWNK